MIGALVSLLSLEMTRRLVAAGSVAATLAVTGATNATPIVLTTSAAHGLLRPAHGVVSGVGGNSAANGLWVLTPSSATTLTLTTFSVQGAVVNSVGSGTYSSGGAVQIAFPDGGILLGRRNVAMQTATAAPRIVFVPVSSPTWELDPYGAVIPTGTIPRTLASQTAEQQTMKLARQLNTERQTFEVHVTGCASPPDPDFGDFDVTQALYHTLYAVMFDLITPPRARVLGGSWVSQAPENANPGSLSQRGQKWVGRVEIAQPVTDEALSFVPTGTVGEFIVNLSGGATGDQTVIVVPSGPPTSLAVAPAYALDTGGSALTINGTGFITGTTVTVGGVAATSVVVVSHSTITCDAPAGTGGNAVDVVVTVPGGGTATASAAVTFYSLPSAVAGLTGWWADTLTTSGASVTQWTDLSGNGRHFAGGTSKPTRVVTGVPDHDTLLFTPAAPGIVPNQAQWLTSGASFHISQLITASEFYWYWLLKVISVQGNFSPIQYSNESVWADNGGSFLSSMILRSTPTIGVYNYGGNIDPTNGEAANAPITLGSYMVATGRHLAGKIGVRPNSGAWVETTSGATQFSFGNSALFIGQNFSGQIGIHAEIAASAVFNAAPTTQQDLAILAYFRQYGALA